MSYFILLFLYRLGTSLTMDQFAWSKTESLYYMGLLMSIGAIMSCITFVMIEPLCKRYQFFVEICCRKMTPYLFLKYFQI